MGFISEMTRNQRRTSQENPFPTRTGRSVWREVFGNAGTDKEEPARTNATPGGSWTRGTSSSEASFLRLLQAMRSMAPGGWSDDRWEQTRHFVGIQYVAIHRTGEQMAQAEFQVFRKDPTHPEGKRPVEGSHELIRLLEKPNKDDSFGDLMYRWNQQMDLTGTALTWMVPNQLGRPYELYSIPTAIAIPQPAINPDFPDGFYRIQPVYPYGPFSSYPTPASAVGAPIPSQWMMRFQYPHPFLRYEGFSPLTALRLHLDEIESMDRSRWYSMKRSINPSAVLNFEGSAEGMQPLTDDFIERIRAELENALASPENAGQLFVAAPGSKLEPWGARPVDMDYQAGWEQLVSFALGAFGITKPAAGMIEDSSYSTLFATLKQLYWLTLEPKVNRIASNLTRHLAPFFGEDLIVEIRCKRIDDHEVLFQRLTQAMNANAITKNEVRKYLDLPITLEDWGDDIAGDPSPKEEEAAQAQQQQMQQAGMPGKDTNQPGASLSGELEDSGDPTEQERPKTGKWGNGSLGPRMKRFNVRAFRNLVKQNGHAEKGKEYNIFRDAIRDK